MVDRQANQSQRDLIRLVDLAEWVQVVRSPTMRLFQKQAQVIRSVFVSFSSTRLGDTPPRNPSHPTLLLLHTLCCNFSPILPKCCPNCPPQQPWTNLTFHASFYPLSEVFISSVFFRLYLKQSKDAANCLIELKSPHG